MTTTVDEIADGVYRLSTYVPEAAEPDGFTFNQFLLMGEEPLLFHCGHRSLFPAVSEAAARVLRLDSIRWITFGHLEADECGSMNRWLAAAPNSKIAHGALGCAVSLNDLADRPPVPMADGEVIDIGGKRVRSIDTPHVLHGWDARLLYEETTATLFCGDLFQHTGPGPPVFGDDIVERAFAAEELLAATALTPATAPTIRRLAGLDVTTLALMHGSSFDGDCEEALQALGDGYERRLLSAIS